MTEVPEPRGELEKVGSTIEGEEEGEEDVRETVLDGHWEGRETSVRRRETTVNRRERTWRVEVLVPQQRFVLKLDSVGQTKVEHRDDHKVVLLNVTNCRSTPIEASLVRSGQLLVDSVLEPRRRERMIRSNRHKATSSESTKVLVVKTFDVVTKENDCLAVKPWERERVVGDGTSGGEGELKREVAHGGDDGLAEGCHESRRRTCSVVR